MLNKCESEIKILSSQIESIKNFDETIKNRKAEMKNSIEIMDSIIMDGAVSDANLRLFIDKIIIHEYNNKLDVSMIIKADFRQHIDFYDENGEISEKVFECVEHPSEISEEFIDAMIKEY